MVERRRGRTPCRRRPLHSIGKLSNVLRLSLVNGRIASQPARPDSSAGSTRRACCATIRANGPALARRPRTRDRALEADGERRRRAPARAGLPDARTRRAREPPARPGRRRAPAALRERTRPRARHRHRREQAARRSSPTSTASVLASERRRTGARSARRDGAARARRGRRGARARGRRASRGRACRRSASARRASSTRVSGRVTLAPQLAGWEGIQLGARLEPSFRCPVLVDNEVRLSLLAERWRGAAQGIDDAFFVQIGVGIGGGVLFGGEVYRGASGAAGEIGYLPLVDGDEPSDGLGPFEHAAGGDRVRRALAGERRPRPPPRARCSSSPAATRTRSTPRRSSPPRRRATPAATEVLDELLDRLARGHRGGDRRARPATVIVGGGVSRAGASAARAARASASARSCRCRRASSSRGSATRRSRSAACGSRSRRSRSGSSTTLRCRPGPRRRRARRRSSSRCPGGREFARRHPDDLEILCGGTLARFVREGHEVVMCHATRGDRGSFVPHLRGDRGDPRRRRRAAPPRSAAPSTRRSGFATPRSARPTAAQRRLVVDLVRETRPDLIITHSPSDYMSDHNEISRLVFDCSFHATLPLFETGEAAPRRGDADLLHGHDHGPRLPADRVRRRLGGDRHEGGDARGARRASSPGCATTTASTSSSRCGRRRASAASSAASRYAEGFVPCLTWLRGNDQAAPAVKG